MGDFKPRIRRREALHTIGAVGALGLAGCIGDVGGDGSSTTTAGGSPGTKEEKETVRAAWAYLTQPGDLGWTFQHDVAVQAVDEKFDWLEVSTSSQVTNTDVGQVMREYANGGQDICFGTSFGYMDPMYDVATDYPDTLFEHCAGFRTRENMGRYFNHQDQAYFLAGIAGGMVTESDTLGFLGSFPIPEVIRFINAFAIGASLNNEKARVKIRWMNSWFDPPKAKQGVQSLVDEGVDVVTGIMDSPSTVKTGNQTGIWSIGANSPMAKFGGDKYITGVVNNWEPFYTETVKAVRDGTWESDFYWGGIGDNAVKLDDWGPKISSDVKNAVSAEKQALIDGDRTVWTGTKFEGKSDKFLFQEMNSLVPQVAAELP